MTDENKGPREAIMKAAREAFASKGFYGAGMEQISKAAGVSKGAVYWHFDGKWELYKAVISAEADRIKEIVLPSGDEPLQGEVMDFFLTRGEGLITVMAEDLLCRLLFFHLQLEAMRGKPEMIEFLTKLRTSITEDVISVMNSIFSGKALDGRGVSTKDLVNMFMSILNGLIINIELTISRDEAVRNWRFLITALLGGAGYEG